MANLSIKSKLLVMLLSVSLFSPPSLLH